jgi:hypothetical protein
MMINLMATASLAVGLLVASPQPREWQTSYGKALEATKSASSPLLVVLDKPNSDKDRIAPELLGEESVGTQSQLLQSYTLCHVDVTTDYGKKVANAFRATSFPHVAIIDKTGSTVLYRTTGKIDAAHWQQVLTQHKSGEPVKAQAVSHVTYKPAATVIYSDPFAGGGSYCPSCQRQSF